MIHRNNSSGHVSATILGACIHGGVTFSRDDQRCATCWNSLEPHDGRTVVTSQEWVLESRLTSEEVGGPGATDPFVGVVIHAAKSGRLSWKLWKSPLGKYYMMSQDMREANISIPPAADTGTREPSRLRVASDNPTSPIYHQSEVPALFIQPSTLRCKAHGYHSIRSAEIRMLARVITVFQTPSLT